MPTVDGAVIHHLLEALGALGLARGALCERAGVDLPDLLAPGTRLPWKDAVALAAAAESLSGDPVVGLHAAEASVSRGLVAVLLRSQPDVLELLRQLDRFEALIVDDLDVTLEQRSPASALTIEIGSGEQSAERHLLEYLAASITIELAHSSRRPFRPAEVRFPHPPAAPEAEYERVLGCSVRFRRPKFEIVISNADLHAPLVTSSPEAAKLLEVALQEDLDLAQSGRFATRVGAALHEAVAQGENAGEEDVASRLAVSVRTMQRRLFDEKTSFRKIRDAVLRDRALTRLEGAAVTISQLAGELGFASVAAFSKAFKRWTGEPPNARRRRNAGARGRPSPHSPP